MTKVREYLIKNLTIKELYEVPVNSLRILIRSIATYTVKDEKRKNKI
ncbi:MAG: hypothetical protein PF693_14475 [Spirochaetia bacterium]|jgi:hypothetical protein|nr:hypothetical protein [Spirochaetia bacterium]